MTFLLVILNLLFLARITSAQPYEPIAIWQREGAGDSSLYGSEILALGDQNDDGFNDWAVYAAGLGYAPPGSPNEPRLEFFHGGLEPDTNPYMVRVKDPATEIAVRGGRALGDLNGDGYVDWGIFTSYWDGSQDRPECKVYFGGPGSHEVPDLIIPITWAYPIGDFNGDGFDDIYLSAWVILYGGDPMDIVPDWSRGISLGYVSGEGDVNHDGYSDFVASDDSVAVYLGGADPDTVPAYRWLINAYFPAIVRDMNDDLYDELCLDRTGGNGWGDLLWGGTSIDTANYVPLDFPCSGSRPMKITSAGDFNADGYGDLIMLREYCPDWYYGTLTMHLGETWISSEPIFALQGWTEPWNLIHFRTAIGLNDVDGDSVDDFAVGANGGIEQLAQRGKAVIFGGDDSLRVAADERTVMPSEFETLVYPNPFNSSATVKIQLPGYHYEVKLVLFDVLGQTVLSVSLHDVLSEASYVLNAPILPSGIYLLRVSSGNLQSTTKLMVLK